MIINISQVKFVIKILTYINYQFIVINNCLKYTYINSLFVALFNFFIVIHCYDK